MTDRFLKYLSFSLIFLLYFLFLSHKIDLSTADLGRHIMNGKIILETKHIPTTNYYSYTEPNFPTLNHHWLSGVIFYLIYSLAGFSGLSIFFILISLTTLFFFLKLRENSFTFTDSAERKSAEAKSDNQTSVNNITEFREGGHTSSWPLITLISLLALPLLAQRTEIRPEIFSYLFCGAYLIILSSLFRSPPTVHRTPDTVHQPSSPLPSQISQNLLGNIQYPISLSGLYLPNDYISPALNFISLLILQVLWVNLHIYFFLGIFLVAVFSFSNLISTRFKSWRFVLTLTSLTALTSLINPYFLNGLLSPLTIFTNYGYRLAENQSVIFMQKLFPNFIYPYFSVLLILLIISCLFCVFRSRFRALCDPLSCPKPPATHVRTSLLLVLSVFFCAFAMLSVRNLALFGLFFIPLISVNLLSIRVIRNIFSKDITKLSLITLLSLLTLLTLALSPQKHFPYWRAYGFGLEQDNLKSVDFYKTNNLPGPIFNNYDIGGYLIYGLYPSQKVFVDNRPEAYSVDFFQKIYVPMQENDTVWQEQLKLHNFQTIYFAWHDMTPWGQTFLKSRLQDKDWSPVYIDNYALIFLRNTEANQNIISRFQIPKETFTFN